MDMDEQLALMQMLFEALHVNASEFMNTGTVEDASSISTPLDEDTLLMQALVNQMQINPDITEITATPPVLRNMSTIMIRNIPRKCTQRMLMIDIVASGYEGVVDFVYLPTDISSGRNLGYAFINFVHPHSAGFFRECFHKKHLSSMRGSRAGLSVSYAVIQGLDANIDNVIKNASVHRIRNPDYLPLIRNKEYGRLVPCVPGGMSRRNSNSASPKLSARHPVIVPLSVRAH